MPFPYWCSLFFDVGSLFSQVSAAKRKTYFLFSQSALATLPSDLPIVYSDFDANFKTLLQFRIGRRGPRSQRHA
jgi:hypothetical protein